ncbi:MAG: hypothetical protein ACQESG_00210 [Nanobdellota archaeon]
MVDVSTYLQNSKRIVIKLGSELINERQVIDFAGDISDLIQKDQREVFLVSSGAIKRGKQRCTAPGPDDIVRKQVNASVGQGDLIDLYRDAFQFYGLEPAQVLVCRNDIDLDLFFADPYFKENPDMRDYLEGLGPVPGGMNGVTGLLYREYTRKYERRQNFVSMTRRVMHPDSGIIAIGNENDTIATQDITFGDNDLLAAHSAKALEADLLLIMTRVDGIYPREAFHTGCYEPIPYTCDIEGLRRECTTELTAHGTGGGISKVKAAEIATPYGTNVFVAGGMRDHAIKRIFEGDTTGTFIYR